MKKKLSYLVTQKQKLGTRSRWGFARVQPWYPQLIIKPVAVTSGNSEVQVR